MRRWPRSTGETMTRAAILMDDLPRQPGRRWQPGDLVPGWWPAMLYAAKNALAALMALGIALRVGLPMPFWAMTTVYIVANPVSAATRSKAIYRVLGTGIGAAVAVALVPMLVESPVLLSLALALWVGGCLAVSLLDRSPRSYVLMLAGYTATIVGFPGVTQPEAVFDIAAARVTEIVLGIACVTVVHSLIAPASLGQRLGPRIEAWLGDAQGWLDDILAAGPGFSAAVVERDRQRLAADAIECQMLASHVPYDTSHWREANRTVQALLYRMLLLLPLLSGLADRRRVLGEDRAVQPALAQVRGWIAQGGDPAARPDVAVDTGPAHTWHDLVRESFLVRLTQASAVLGEARLLKAGIDDPAAVIPPALTGERMPSRLAGDVGLALLSGGAATVAIVLVCAFWIVSGWSDGAGAAVLTGVFCCLFAGMDNPVPMILSFGAAITAGVPLAGVWLFAILPQVNGFAPLCLALLPVMLGVGGFLMHPRFGLLATAFLMGFFSALALQQSYTADLERFINSNIGQGLAVVAAAGVSAAMRGLTTEAAIARLVRRQWAELARLAAMATPPDPVQVLGRSSDHLGLITQRLGVAGGGDRLATTGLREVRVAVNIAQIQHLRAGADRPLRVACTRLLRSAARHFSRSAPGTAAPAGLLLHIDRALRFTLGPEAPRAGVAGELIGSDPATGRAALVALRRNLFPDAPAFMPERAA